ARSTLRTLPREPRSLPAITSTVSPTRICISHHLSRKADDFHEVLVTQLAGHGSKDTRAARILFVVDQDHGIGVESDVAAVRPTGRRLAADDHPFNHGALLDVTAGDNALHAADNNVAQPRRPPARSAQHFDAHHLFRAGV